MSQESPARSQTVSVTNKAAVGGSSAQNVNRHNYTFLPRFVHCRINSLAKPTFLRPSKLRSPSLQQSAESAPSTQAAKAEETFSLAVNVKRTNGTGGTSGNLALASFFFFFFLLHSHRSLLKTLRRTQNSEVHVYKKSDTNTHTCTL